MKKFVALLLALSTGFSLSQELSDVDRQLLLERLEEIQKSSESAKKSRFAAAITAFRAGVVSDAAANDLWQQCWEKVDFEDEAKSAKNFRERRKVHKDRVDSPGFRRALRYQLSWLLLTIEASEKGVDRSQMSDKAISMIENILGDAKTLESQSALLKQSVLGCHFAKAYNLDGLTVENWSLAPLNISSMYENIILPPWQNSESLAMLRKGWVKRIEHEGLSVELFTSEGEDDRKPAMEKWLQNGRLDLVWSMERDIFKYGNQSDAALRMLDHLQKNLKHSKASGWIAEFSRLMKGEPDPPEVPAEEVVEEAPVE